VNLIQVVTSPLENEITALDCFKSIMVISLCRLEEARMYDELSSISSLMKSLGTLLLKAVFGDDH